MKFKLKPLNKIFRKNIVLIVLILTVVVSFFHGGLALAQGEYDDLEIQDVFDIISGLACWFYSIAISLTVVFMIITAIKFLTVKGDAAKAAESRKTLMYVFIAIVVIFGVNAIIATVAGAVGAGSSFIPFSC